MAQNEGKKFEEDFKKSIPDSYYWIRLRDPAQSFGGQNNLRFSLKNPYDLLIYTDGFLFPLELKSTKGTSFSFKGSSPMIKQQQIDDLTKAATYKGIIPGFIFNMRKYTKTYFLHINNFNKFLSQTDKSSINQQDIIDFGGIEIVGKLKKVRYQYMIWELINYLKTEVTYSL